jgi:hypothetical protein
MKNIKPFEDFGTEPESFDEKMNVLPNKEVRDIVDKIRKAVEQKVGKTDAQEIGDIIGKILSEDYVNEAKMPKFIDKLEASSVAKNVLYNLDTYAQLSPDYSPVEAIAYIEEGLKKSGNAIKKAEEIMDLLYTAGLLANDMVKRDVLSLITDGIAGKLVS